MKSFGKERIVIVSYGSWRGLLIIFLEPDRPLQQLGKRWGERAWVIRQASVAFAH